LRRLADFAKNARFHQQLYERGQKDTGSWKILL